MWDCGGPKTHPWLGIDILGWVEHHFKADSSWGALPIRWPLGSLRSFFRQSLLQVEVD